MPAHGKCALQRLERWQMECLFFVNAAAFAARKREAENIRHNPIIIAGWLWREVTAARWRFNETFTQTFGRFDPRPK